MSKKTIIIISALISVVAFFFYLVTKTPADIEVKGMESFIPWISLATALTGLFTSIITLALKIIEMKQQKKEDG